jgi:CBS domain-containing protein
LVAGNSYHDEGSIRGLCVQDLATPVKVTVNPTTDLFAVVHRFFTTRVRLLPVVDCGILVGVVSRRDVLQVILTL